jgi:hypothetical protein
MSGGERGIRTPDTLSGTSVFKTDAINHSASSPLYSKYHFGDLEAADKAEPSLGL